MRRSYEGVFIALCAGTLWSSGCASLLGPVMIDGVSTPRLTEEFTGNPYSIRHTGAHPKPGSPSGGVEGSGGSIFGSVCGADIQYDVTHNKDHVLINGFLDNLHTVSLQIREANQIRRIQGSLGNFAVDVLVTDDVLAGSVGRCRYELKAQPDSEVGNVFSQLWRSQGFTADMRIQGIQELTQMPAAEQAALVPLMLYCGTAKLFENMGRSPPPLRFGGKPGSQPNKTINFGARPYTSCGGN
jgi:hypothetical protein